LFFVICIMEKAQSIEGFYNYYSNLIPPKIKEEAGIFDVFTLEDLGEAKTRCSAYGRKEYFKISLMKGHTHYAYGDREATFKQYALVFADPHTPYQWDSQDPDQSGIICIFTLEFFHNSAAKRLQEYPVFKDLDHAILHLTKKEYAYFLTLFNSLIEEAGSDYFYKYDVIRNITLEIIHAALKIQSVAIRKVAISGAERITAEFTKLLESQFPIENNDQRVKMRFAADYSEALLIHVNHLNKAVREITGKTTSTLIAERLVQEAKILLKHTQWSVSEIAWCLGFEELPHLINFFKKHTGQTPKLYRNA
jgi:AraC family transcriptional activator of pobA